MVPLLGSLAVVEMVRLGEAGRAPLLVLGLAAGAAWQLLFRRDLLPRLTWPAAFGGVVVAVAIARGEPIALGDDAAETSARLLYSFGVLCGLVAAEQYLRWRDRRAERLSLEEGPATSRGSA